MLEYFKNKKNIFKWNSHEKLFTAYTNYIKHLHNSLLIFLNNSSNNQLFNKCKIIIKANTIMTDPKRIVVIEKHDIDIHALYYLSTFIDKIQLKYEIKKMCKS